MARGWMVLLALLTLSLRVELGSSSDMTVGVDGSAHEEAAVEPPFVADDEELPMVPLASDPSQFKLEPIYLRSRARMRSPSPDGDESSALSTFSVDMSSSLAREDAPVDDAAQVVHIMARLHAQQRPELRVAADRRSVREVCASTRLLVIQFAASSFEGIGSILKLLMLGLAEAAYSNRTLVWGLDTTPMLEQTRPMWSAPPNSTTVHGVPLDCDVDTGGGAYGCFFQPLSSCSLADVTWAELTQLGVDPHDDASRVRLHEARRSPVAYYPPPGILPDNASYPRHKWASALAAYAFRLKPAMHAAFEATRARVGMRTGAACMHVRHGDVAAMPDVYTNRKAFPFKAYFDALYAMPTPAPDSIFIASDSEKLADALRAERKRSKWRAAGSPQLLSVLDESSRFVTEHGSHTVAAEGACTVKNTCSLQWYDILRYKQELAAKGVPKHVRMMDVLYESLEDLHLLSHCGRMVTILCSHYSTFAALLMWARTGGAAVDLTRFLDEDRIIEGELQDAFLHGSVNQTNRAVPGVKRWRSMQLRYANGLWPTEFAERLRSPKELIHHEHHLPILPAHVLIPEAKRWIAPVHPLVAEARGAAALAAARIATRVWPGECPVQRIYAEDDFSYVARLINAGAEHNEIFHYHQAVLCWKEAERLLDSGQLDLDDDKVETYLDVATENIRAVQEQQFYPYHTTQQRLASLVKAVLRLPAGAALRIPRALVEDDDDEED